jgi:hypothetical protein
MHMQLASSLLEQSKPQKKSKSNVHGVLVKYVDCFCRKCEMPNGVFHHYSKPRSCPLHLLFGQVGMTCPDIFILKMLPAPIDIESVGCL